jgi:hypothetical protein
MEAVKLPLEEIKKTPDWSMKKKCEAVKGCLMV